MKRRVGLLLFLLVWWPTLATGQDTPGLQSLDQLLERVQAKRKADAQLQAEREAQFLAERNTQRERLQEARTALRQLQQRNEQLSTIFEANETRLAELGAELDDKAASLGELFGVVRQTARDTSSLLLSSLVSAQLGDRTVFLNTLSESKALASFEELEQFWIVLLEEMVQSGKVVSFLTRVVQPQGEQVEQEVTRIGAFNVVSHGNYLRYLPETGQLAVLGRQPERRYQQDAQALEEASHGYTAFGLDPSRGAILAALVQTPDIWERLEQGGLIGYIILALGGVTFILILERAVSLWREGHKIQVQLQDTTPNLDNALGRVLQVQLQDTTPNLDNALGRVLQVYSEAPALATESLESLEAHLEEAVSKQIPKIERGLSVIGILAAVAPLLGLLGTVVGMIGTFQSIALFGAGDPRVMAGGISQALVTTQLGLTVAIPTILLHTILSNKSTRLVQILDEQTAGLLAKGLQPSLLQTEDSE
jgi:biopolymer transport protein ExbB